MALGERQKIVYHPNKNYFLPLALSVFDPWLNGFLSLSPSTEPRQHPRISEFSQSSSFLSLDNQLSLVFYWTSTLVC